MQEKENSIKKERFTHKRQLATHVWNHLQAEIRDAKDKGIDHLLGVVGTSEFARAMVESFYEKYDLGIPESLKPDTDLQKRVARVATSPVEGMLRAKQPKVYQDDSHDKYKVIEKDYEKYQKCKKEKKKGKWEGKLLKDLDTDRMVNSFAGTFVSELVNKTIIAISLNESYEDFRRQFDKYAEEALKARGDENTAASNQDFTTFKQQCGAVRAVSPILMTMPIQVVRILGNKTVIPEEDVPALCRLALERHQEMAEWLDSAVASSTREKETLEAQKRLNAEMLGKVEAQLHESEKEGSEKEVSKETGRVSLSNGRPPVPCIVIPYGIGRGIEAPQRPRGDAEEAAKEKAREVLLEDHKLSNSCHVATRQARTNVGKDALAQKGMYASWEEEPLQFGEEAKKVIMLKEAGEAFRRVPSEKQVPAPTKNVRIEEQMMTPSSSDTKRRGALSQSGANLVSRVADAITPSRGEKKERHKSVEWTKKVDIIERVDNEEKSSKHHRRSNSSNGHSKNKGFADRIRHDNNDGPGQGGGGSLHV